MNSFRATISQASNRPRARRGFTLIELLVVMVIIALVTSSVLPSAITIFTAGADAQAANLLAAQLAAARALAITEGTHAGVHVQKADPVATGLTDAWFSAIVWDDPTTTPSHQFTLAPGFTPRRLPGSIIFGEISNRTYTATGYRNLNTDDFVTFTVVFSPTGSAVKQVATSKIRFDTTHELFAGDAAENLVRLWDGPVANESNGATGPGEAGATAVILFDFSEFRKLTTNKDRATFMVRRGQLFPINVYTGQLFAR